MHLDLHGALFNSGMDSPLPGTSQQITLLLDRSHRIAFASSAIQSWLGHDYEALPGVPVTTLIPSLQSFPEWERYCLQRQSRLYKPWSIFTFVLHADGRHLPAMVCMPAHDKGLSMSVMRLMPVSQA